MSKHPGVRGLPLNHTHPKANRNQGTSSGDGGSTCTRPKLRNFLIIPYGLHGLQSHHEYRLVARGRQRLWLGARGKDRLPGHASVCILVSILSFFLSRIRESRRHLETYVKLLPSTSRIRSSYPAVKTLPSGVPMSPETRFVCPWPLSGAASPAES